MCDNVKSDLLFKHSLICYCVGNCNTAHAGWLGAGSMKEVDVKQLRMQRVRGCAAHHEGAGEGQEVTELPSSINTHFQNVVVATSDTIIVFHAVACYLSIFTHAR